MQLEHTYLSLSDKFYSEQKPITTTRPNIIYFNNKLADELGISQSEEELLSMLAGNDITDGMRPFAQAYAGHQFGHFTMLGDGRAIMLGELVSPEGKRYDIQLKGSGRTPYSRGGDGRATLYSMLREYLISEAMHHLGIPTSRSLAVVTTGDNVRRQVPHDGAVLTRVASSHIRVGTFEFAARFTGIPGLRELLHYTVKRHDPDLADLPEGEKAAKLLKRVCERQAELVTHWMRVGFIHGVMNTDNTGLAGETFDYGPCAFMNEYDLKTVFSSIDSFGRYSFGNQPRIMQWNMAVFASALMPLMSENTETAKEIAEGIVDDFANVFTKKWEQMLVSKIGFTVAESSTNQLAEELLDWMSEHNADYINTFRILSTDKIPENSVYDSDSFKNWKTKWFSELEKRNISKKDAFSRMKSVNPAFIPRNHIVENALESAANDKNLDPLNILLKKLQNPYPKECSLDELQEVPKNFDETYQTFCGT